jgi:hypothetical protein
MTHDPPLNSAQALARFLCGIGYDRAQIEVAVRQDFPDADASAVVEAAMRHAAQWDEELDREVQQERDAAIAAEHDTGGQ